MNGLVSPLNTVEVISYILPHVAHLSNVMRNLAHFGDDYRRGMKKHIEILFIKVAIWILMGRNLTRCVVVSRRPCHIIVGAATSAGMLSSKAAAVLTGRL
jgi:hypothetical protein